MEKEYEKGFNAVGYIVNWKGKTYYMDFNSYQFLEPFSTDVPDDLKTD